MIDDWSLTETSLCRQHHTLRSEKLGVCRSCIDEKPVRALKSAEQAHRAGRRLFSLPETVPQTAGGIQCGLCGQDCIIGEGEIGFCNLRTNRQGRLIHRAGTPARGLLQWYRDPLPSNCVADPFCGGHSRSGQHNLAVFYSSCTFDCLFCQNWHYRESDPEAAPGISAAELAGKANRQSYCVCYFGGDPASQMPHSLDSGRRLAEAGLAVCWETAGSAHPQFMDKALSLSLRSGGTIKFDLKAYDECLHRVLTGASNTQSLENFRRAAARFSERPEPPPGCRQHIARARLYQSPGSRTAGRVHRRTKR